MNERISNKHMARVTEFDHVTMNLNTWGRRGRETPFGACVKEESEGVLIWVEETASHGRVKCEGDRR